MVDLISFETWKLSDASLECSMNMEMRKMQSYLKLKRENNKKLLIVLHREFKS